ncbi:rfaE bifunctional protein, domain II [Syntrophus gentianae]|uniref:D-glycero-beta-D-manno-heptose 1-phosphate adenylyltransferase n=1 Tax=Syntrophus gentianae TaxID=43775 RepID=A0A1H7XLJ3_9BACT|nr:D-glycero-beta-D-manno-heptose 1-phosphate adenylyltransferase [Syntrophus gentianae]SEM34555.1 rfaE bifunctional protein, domain II [Syntrophus gentianae]
MGKILDWENLKRTLDELRREGKKIAFTNGCFDILHVGHTRYLRQAREKGDVLVLALNSDASVRKIKGEKRPLIPEDERADLLSCLEFVDYVTIFDETTPLKLILYLKPDVLIKGGDWAEDQVVGREEVRSWGGSVAIIPEIPGASTTNIVEKILMVYGEKA